MITTNPVSTVPAAVPNGDVDAAAVERLAREAGLPAPADWTEPPGYPDSLALCAIDSVYSLQSRYSATVRVLDRYRAARRAEGADPAHDGATDLLDAIDRSGGPVGAAVHLLGSQAKAPGTRGAVLKSAALAQAVAGLRGLGVETTADLRAADPVAAGSVWRVRGLGPVSWEYLLMLAGTQGVKADTMVRRFVTTAVGAGSLVSSERAGTAVKAVAARLDVTERAFDHAIWGYQRTR